MYVFRLEEELFNRIPLTASADGEVRNIYWFADGVFLGRSSPSQTLLWLPSPGEYDLILIDDTGLSDERRVMVSMEP